MANRGGSVECRACGARSNSYPFGEETFRRAVAREVSHSEDPVIRSRRERARAIRRQNRRG